jgi:hypothetical protein
MPPRKPIGGDISFLRPKLAPARPLSWLVRIHALTVLSSVSSLKAFREYRWAATVDPV